VVRRIVFSLKSERLDYEDIVSTPAVDAHETWQSV